jgi:hypothetical protein
MTRNADKGQTWQQIHDGLHVYDCDARLPRMMRDDARELAEGIVKGIVATVDNNGELDPGYPANSVGIVTKLIEVALAPAQADALEALESVESIVEFYLKREIESPANHQEFAYQAQKKLNKFRHALAAVDKLRGDTK